MASRLPRTRPSRPAYRKPVGVGPLSRETLSRFVVEDRRRRLGDRLEAMGARLDRDPNGYAIAKDGRFVARCPNLDAVESWLTEQDRLALRALIEEA